MKPVFCIVFISPNGSTAQVAQTLTECLKQGGAEVMLADLAGPEAVGAAVEKATARQDTVLIVGSPVYRDVAVPPVAAFIDRLPPAQGGRAVPFVTYGRACSGVALWQMAGCLQAKGYRISGAAKVAAVHSMMWQSAHPAGEGHPDDEDLAQMRRLADRLLKDVCDDRSGFLDLDELDYQPDELGREFKAKIGRPWVIVPKTVNQGACTACGLCAAQCPAGAIALNPTPAFGDACFDCFNCIRLCPENAIAPAVPMARIEAMIRERVAKIDEQPLTRVFLP